MSGKQYMKILCRKLFLCCFLSSCFLLPQKNYIPALLVEMTPEIKIEIEQIITSASNGTKSTISDNAFKDESLIIIERNKPSNSKFKLGRILSWPDRYQLIISDNGQCFIRHSKTKLQWFLFKAKCKPL